MKLLKLVGVMISLLVFSMSVIQGVSASPAMDTASTSEGCTFANFSVTGPQIHTVAKFFNDDDTIHVTASVPSTIVLSDSGYDYSQTYTNVTSANLNIPSYFSGEYIIDVHRSSGTGNFHITSTCTPSPISDRCEILNDYYVDGGYNGGTFNAGEQYRIMSTNVTFNLTVSGAASASFTNIPVSTFQYYTFPVTGTYTLTISNRLAQGLYQCTVPRRIILH